LSQDGSTPLHEAAGAGHIEAMRTLLAAKADPETANNVSHICEKPFEVSEYLECYDTFGRMAILLDSALKSPEISHNTRQTRKLAFTQPMH